MIPGFLLEIAFAVTLHVSPGVCDKGGFDGAPVKKSVPQSVMAMVYPLVN